MPQISAIQRELRAAKLDGWLFYDFHHRDPIGAHVLGLDQSGLGTRRWFYLIPARGTPGKLVHRIESSALDTLPGRKLLYASGEELSKNLSWLIGRARNVAMQYSPRNAIPYLSMVDAGTVELVRAQGCKVVSSADLVQKFEATWSAEQYHSHLDAGRVIDRITQEAFGRAAAMVKAKAPLSEYELQQWMLERFRAGGVTTAEPPIVAVGPHSGDPHYEPRAQGSAPIRKGDLLLLDVWGKMDRPGSVYYDITWVGYLGERVPEKHAKIFAVVSKARDQAVAFVQQSLARGKTISGWQVDDAARQVIREAGYAKYFVHRTGHNIGQEVHGNGANMDNLETHDMRQLLPQTCFSIEPGIYLPEFGVRSEVDVYVEGGQARVTGPVQTAILPLLTQQI
jgi:Xaa-Pro dipeptidase